MHQAPRSFSNTMIFNVNNHLCIRNYSPCSVMRKLSCRGIKQILRLKRKKKTCIQFRQHLKSDDLV